MNIAFHDFAITPYRECWDRQKAYFQELLSQKKAGKLITEAHVLIGEHPHVYTVGFHGNASNMFLDEVRLKSLGAEFIRIERGGDVTYHGPGQMIVYPILDLEKLGMGVKSYMSMLEECVIRLLDMYGIKGERVDGATGVWLGKGRADERKICAMGVKCTRFVTMHGLALNVNTDMNYFNAINPCGFVDKGVTSMKQELGMEIPMDEVKEKFSALLTEQICNAASIHSRNVRDMP